MDSVVTNGQTKKFQYNAAGLRIRKTTATADINYVLNGAQVLAETERGCVPGSVEMRQVMTSGNRLTRPRWSME